VQFKKEAYLLPFNSFLDQHREDMMRFLSEVCQVPPDWQQSLERHARISRRVADQAAAVVYASLHAHHQPLFDSLRARKKTRALADDLQAMLDQFGSPSLLSAVAVPASRTDSAVIEVPDSAPTTPAVTRRTRM
jgi:hypothetical protein